MNPPSVGLASGKHPAVEYEHIGSRPAMSFFDEGDALRQKYPFFWNTVAQGFWVFTGYEAIREALQTPEVFTNDSFIPTDPDPTYHMIPTNENPPRHVKYRQLLNPQFSPAAVARLEPIVREHCRETIDEFLEHGSCDLVRDFGGAFPTKVFLEWAALPPEDSPQFVAWVQTVFSGIEDSAAPEVVEAMAAIQEYFRTVIADRRARPRDPRVDVVTHLVQASLDDAPLSDDELVNICQVLVLAGLDTVKQELGYAFLHLATHPDDRKRLVDSPELIPIAVEEMLRAFPVAPPGRKLARDIDFHGCPMHQGEMVWLPVYMANRDPRAFPDADKVVLDRNPNRHLAFAAGPHRCQGAHLARLQMKVAFEEWHRRIPDYRLGDDEIILEHGGQLGLERLPIAWDVPSKS